MSCRRSRNALQVILGLGEKLIHRAQVSSWAADGYDLSALTCPRVCKRTLFRMYRSFRPPLSMMDQSPFYHLKALGTSSRTPGPSPAEVQAYWVGVASGVPGHADSTPVLIVCCRLSQLCCFESRVPPYLIRTLLQRGGGAGVSSQTRRLFCCLCQYYEVLYLHCFVFYSYNPSRPLIRSGLFPLKTCKNMTYL